MERIIQLMLDTLKTYDINLSMFVKIIDDKTAMIIIGQKELVSDRDNFLIVTNAVNILNIYREEYANICFAMDENCNKQDIDNYAISNILKNTITIKTYKILQEHLQSIEKVILVDTENNVLCNGMKEIK